MNRTKKLCGFMSNRGIDYYFFSDRIFLSHRIFLGNELYDLFSGSGYVWNGADD